MAGWLDGWIGLPSRTTHDNILEAEMTGISCV